MLRRRLVATLLACFIAVPVAAGARAAAAPVAAAEQTRSNISKENLNTSASPIKHVVVLFLENESFDSLLGFWCDIHRSRCPVGGMPKSVTLSDGAVVTPAVQTKETVPNVTHSVSSQLAAMNIQNGVPRMNGWQNIGAGQCDAASHYRCISGYAPKMVPNLALLADKFAISDATFSLADSPSWGGHLDIVTSNLDGFLGTVPISTRGTPRGAGWGCDSDKITPWQPPNGSAPQMMPGCVPDPSLTYKGAPLANGGAFEGTQVAYQPTIMDSLDKAGLTWKFYTGSCQDELTEPDGQQFCQKPDLGYSWSICPSLAECLYTQSSHMVVPDQFGTDAAAGNLPAFSVITPSVDHLQASEHNGAPITTGDDWIGQIASELEHSPEWDSSVLFITWDDCGCFYDQAKPGINPDGTQQGPRLPMVIVSPYAKPKYTDSTATTFNGVLAFVERNFHLPPLGPNDANAYGYKNAFNYAQNPLQPVPMVNRPLPPGTHTDWAELRQDT